MGRRSNMGGRVEGWEGGRGEVKGVGILKAKSGVGGRVGLYERLEQVSGVWQRVRN